MEKVSSNKLYRIGHVLSKIEFRETLHRTKI